MKAKTEFLDCNSFKKHKLGWAYDSLRHIEQIEKIMMRMGDMPDEMIWARLIGSAITVSCYWNILLPFHGSEECLIGGKNDCIVPWVEDFLEAYDIPHLNDAVDCN